MRWLKRFYSQLAPKITPIRELYIGVLVAVFFAIFITNFSFTQWFSGWDNLHPEFNVLLNIKRGFTAVWQENQGLGHLGGHGHAANLLHAIFIGLLSFVLPVMYLRSVFTFLMLFSGGFGAFFLANYLFRKRSDRQLHYYSAAFLSSLLYVLNLSTVENFFVQLESFILFYGLLPWTTLALFKYIDKPTKKTLLMFFFASVLMSTTGFIPPLFITYGIMLGFVFLSVLISKKFVPTLKTFLTIGAVIFIANAYWLLPTAYFTATTSQVYLNSQNNQLSTQDFNLMSQSYGGLLDVILLKGFVLGAVDSPLKQGQPNFFVMKEWIAYTDRLPVQVVGVTFFIFVLIGTVSILTRRKSPFEFALFATFLFMFAALAQRVFPFSVFDEFLKTIPVINQAFRAGFTKLSVPLTLTFCMLFGYGMVSFFSGTEKVFKRSFVKIFVPFFALLILFFSYPVFQGQFLYGRLKVSLPDEYFQVFEYFSQQPKDQRIAHIPVQWNWGWNIYTWGYTGSGFLWYGIEQPLMDRSFDVWSSANESFYQEISTAVYQKNAQQLDDVLKKYDIAWLLIDSDLTLPGFGEQILYLDEIEALLKEIPSAKLVKEFGHISIYQTATESSKFLSTPNTAQPISTVDTYNRHDPVFATLGQYYQDLKGTQFPFSHLFQARQLKNIRFENEHIILEENVANNGTLVIPSYPELTKVPVEVTAVSSEETVEVQLKTLLPVVNVGTENYDNNFSTSVTLQVPKNSTAKALKINNHVFALENGTTEATQTLSLLAGDAFDITLITDEEVDNFDILSELRLQPARTCWIRDENDYVVEKETTDQGFILKSKNASSCVYKRLGKFSTLQGRTLHITFDARSNNGGKADLCVDMEGPNPTCINEDMYTMDVSSPEWKSFDVYVPMEDSGTYWVNLLGRTSDVLSEIRETEYRNVTVDVINSSSTEHINKEFWDPLFQTREYTVNRNDALRVDVLQTIRQIWNPLSDTGPVGNCSLSSIGQVSQSIQSGSITLDAKNGGVACKNAIFSNLFLDQEYLVHVQGKHLKGRGFKFYAFNTGTGRQDLEYLMPPEDFNATYSLLEWPDNNQGYNIGLESRSFPFVDTTNTVDEVSVHAFPLKWIASFHIKPENDPSVNGTQLKITSAKKSGTFFYDVLVDAKTSGLIKLSQGFHTGWTAFDLKNTSVLDHVVIDSWANGWKVPQGADHIYILFWPQLLGFAGYILLLPILLYSIILSVLSFFRRS